MAGLAAVTDKIKLIASTAILTLPPAITARMASTISSIAPEKFEEQFVRCFLKDKRPEAQAAAKDCFQKWADWRAMYKYFPAEMN